MARSLRGFRLVASRFSQLAACSGAPSHRLPKAQDYAIMADYIRDLRLAKWGSMINLRSLSASPNGRQRSDVMSFQTSIISFVLQLCR